MRDAARRIAILLAVVLGITALASALVGLLAGSSLSRAISSGFYIVGCFLIVLGFFSGIRGPIRPRGKEEDVKPLASFFGAGLFWSGIRTATTDERMDALSTAWLFLLLGVTLVLAGVAIDSRASFF